MGTLQLQTKYFGTIPCEEEDILQFSSGLFGFEEEQRFVLLPFEGNPAMLSLQSVTTPGLAFVVMNPFMLKPDYAPVLRPEELQAMETQQSTDLCYYVMCVMRTPVESSTLNLRCPVVINDKTRQAMQVILEDSNYQMRHPIADFSVGGGATC